MRPQADDYPDYLERTVRALLAEGIDAGARELQPIAFEPRDIPRRPEPTRYMSGQIFARDRFCCRYCSGKIIPAPIMEIIGTIYPQIFPYHLNWRGGRTHPAVIARSGVADHVVPASLGGSKADNNLVTACNPCNSIKADFTLDQLGWGLQDIPSTQWDGLTKAYAELWRLAGYPRVKYHKHWMYVFGIPIPEIPDASSLDS